MVLPSAVSERSPSRAWQAQLPAWPVTSLFALTPVWWLLGLLDAIWIVYGLIMAVLLVLSRRTTAPTSLVVWLIFIGFMFASATQLGRANGSIVVFSYRAALYVSATVLLLYVYNMPEARRARTAMIAFVAYWGWTAAGGLLALARPELQIKTPLYYLLSAISPGLLNNPFLNRMAIRRAVQVPEGVNYLGEAPRPKCALRLYEQLGEYLLTATASCRRVFSDPPAPWACLVAPYRPGDRFLSACISYP